MRTLTRAVLLIGCCEFLPFTRRYFGLGFGFLLALVFALKHQLLIYVPVSLYYQKLHEVAAIALVVQLMGRFMFRGMMVSHAGVPAGAQGIPWLCWLGIPAQAARRYGEPLLVLAFAVWAAGSVVFLRFQPALRWEFLPLPYGVPGVTEPFPFWYREYAVMIAHSLPVLSAVALALFNRLDGPRKAKAPAKQEEPATFSEVELPRAARLPVPSVAVMALSMTQEGKSRGSKHGSHISGNGGGGPDTRQHEEEHHRARASLPGEQRARQSL